MYITWLELKKALLSPVFFILLFVIIGFNLFLIWSDSYNKQELKVINEIIEKYGASFNDDVLQQMEQDINDVVQAFGGTNAQPFFEDLTLEQYEEASLEQQQQINHAGLLYAYLQSAKGLESRYATIDIPKLKQIFITEENLPAWLEQKMTDDFDSWHARFNEIMAKNEYKQWFFLSDYRMHSNLFSAKMKTLALEGVLLVALLTVLITNYEFEKKTQLVIYSTKNGRKLIWHKFFASMIGSLFVILVLFGLTLLSYFMVYDYSAVWQTPISSGFNWEYKLPYITWWEIPLWQYLIFAIGILSSVLLMVSLLTFSISVFLKNTYFAWCLCILVLVSMFVVPFYFTNSTAQWLMHFNITLLLLNPHLYFDGGTTYTMTKYHELYTLLLWGGIVILGSMLAIRYFNRKDVV